MKKRISVGKIESLFKVTKMNALKEYTYKIIK